MRKPVFITPLLTISIILWASLLLNAQNLSVKITASDSIGCDGDIINLDAVASGSTTGNYQYAWRTSDGTLTSPSGIQTSLVLGANDAQVSVIVTDGTNDTASNTITIDSKAINVVLPDSIYMGCGMDTLITPIINGDTSSVSYKWLGSSRTDSTKEILVDVTECLGVLTTNLFGCYDDDVINIQVGPILEEGTDFKFLNLCNFDSLCIDIDDRFELVAPIANNANYNLVWHIFSDTFNTRKPSFIPYEHISGILELDIPVELSISDLRNANCVYTKTKYLDIYPPDACCHHDFGPPIGIHEDKNEISIVLFPNPTNGVLTLNTSELSQSGITVELFNSIGKQIYLAKNSSSIGQYTIDLSNQQNGIYILKLVSENRTYTSTITLQK